MKANNKALQAKKGENIQTKEEYVWVSKFVEEFTLFFA